MRLDAHQHFWQYTPDQYDWITSEMSVLQRSFLPDDLRPLLAGAGFDGCVAVQARQTLDETRWLLHLASQHSFIKAVVGWVDLRSDQLPAQLEAFSANSKLAGVRHVVQDEPDDDFVLQPAFRRGIAQLRDYHLTYDLLLHPRHLRAATDLAKEFPEQPFVLDHLAKPKIAERLLSPWREDLLELAKLPNVYCKLSGLVTEARWLAWDAADFEPYLRTALGAFGWSRLMIGSDWPVCLLSADYDKVMRLVMDFVRTLPAEAQDAVLGETCARFYGIRSKA